MYVRTLGISALVVLGALSAQPAQAGLTGFSQLIDVTHAKANNANDGTLDGATKPDKPAPKESKPKKQ